MSNTTRLDQIRARVEVATEGPWYQGRDSVPFESAKEVYSEQEPSMTSEDLCSAWYPADASFIAHARADVPALLAAVDAVLALHKPIKIYDECECPEGTHPDEYEWIETPDYSTCHNAIKEIACQHCCTEGTEYVTENCAVMHKHTLDPNQQCPTVRAVTGALNA